MAGFLDWKMCHDACAMVQPHIELLMNKKVFKREHMCIVVADPLVMAHSSFIEWLAKGMHYEHCIGEKSSWEYGFDVFARNKAYMSVKYGMSTYEILTLHPHLLAIGDILYGGSAVSNGLVVATSGVQPEYDEMVSKWVIAAIEAECKFKRAKLDPNGPNGPFLK